MKGKRAYLALIGDVVGSRSVVDRGLVQERLNASLVEANQAFEEQIAAAFLITIGDEFQGLLTSSSGIDHLIAKLRLGVHPVGLRFGIGIGPLDTPLQQQAIGMDGPCFHRARSALERAKENRTVIEVGVGEPNNTFEIYSELYSLLRRNWTDRQREISDLATVGYTGREIAEQLSITPSAVSQHLKAAGADAVRAATERWMDELKRVMQTNFEQGGGI